MFLKALESHSKTVEKLPNFLYYYSEISGKREHGTSSALLWFFTLHHQLLHCIHFTLYSCLLI